MAALHTEIAGKEFSFLVRPCPKRTSADPVYYFTVSTKEELRDWVTKINKTAHTWHGWSIEALINSAKHNCDDTNMTKIISFWFHAIDGPQTILTKDHLIFWMIGSQGCDCIIKRYFKAIWEQAINGELDHWAQTPVGALALVLLFDQITRCIFRDTPEMFSADTRAQQILKMAIEKDYDRVLPVYMRIWLYNPLSRIEDLNTSDRLIKLFEEMVSEVDDPQSDFWLHVIKHLQDLNNILKQFGRFPSYNKILGRKSTLKEKVFTMTADSTFFF